MAEVPLNLPKETKPTPKSHQWFKKTLPFLWNVWPLAAIYLGTPRLYRLLIPLTGKTVAIHLTFVWDLIILGVAVLFHQSKWGRSFAIVLAAANCFNQVMRAFQYLPRKLNDFPDLWVQVLYQNMVYLFLMGVLAFSVFKACRYLWNHAGYHKLFFCS